MNIARDPLASHSSDARVDSCSVARPRVVGTPHFDPRCAIPAQEDCDSTSSGHVMRAADGHSLRLVAFGVTVEVRVSHQDLVQDVCNCLPPGWQSAPHLPAGLEVAIVRDGLPGTIARTEVFVDSERVLETQSWSEALHCLESHIQLHVAEMTREWVFVHAGVVGWRGQAILLPGRSFAGKSSLVAALLKAGAEYLSDEYAVCDSNGLVYPYARRLSLRQDDGAKLRRPRPEDFGSRTSAGPLPIGLVAMTKYVAGARWRPTHAPRGWAALALLDNMVPIRRQPGRCLHVAHLILAGAPCLRGKRGEAEDAARALLAAVPVHAAQRRPASAGMLVPKRPVSD